MRDLIITRLSKVKRVERWVFITCIFVIFLNKKLFHEKTISRIKLILMSELVYLRLIGFNKLDKG